MTDIVKKLSRFVNCHRLVVFCQSFLGMLFTTFSAWSLALESYSDSAYREACDIEKIEAKYSASECWSCDIIKILIEKMSSVIVAISGAPIVLGETILLWGSAVWLAAYFLKSVGALAAQDPSKVLDGAFIFMFKVAFVYVLLHEFGFEYLVDNIVNPVLEIGMEIGTSLMNT